LLVYDVTKRESFTNLAEVWTKEIELHSTNKECVKMLVGNKVDKVMHSLIKFLFRINIGVFDPLANADISH
jgi:GTPase SAR1 family protein